MKLIFLVLIILVALLVLAIKFLPWWASLLLLVAGFWGVRWGTKFLFRRLLSIPFKLKGKVLSEAAVRLHDIQPAPIPTPQTYDDEDVDEETLQRFHQLSWYYLDVSIRPSENTDSGRGFTAWEPGELLLVSSTAKAMNLEEDVDSDVCEIYEIKIYRDGQFGEDEEYKYTGAQRLQLYIGVQPQINQLKFRYYFELFGLINIPVHKLPSTQGNATTSNSSFSASSLNQQSPLEQAKQGNVVAIAALINRSIQSKGITAKVVLKDGCLKVMLEAEDIPDQKLFAPYICKGVFGLGIPTIQLLQVYGRRAGDKIPVWTENFTLNGVVPQLSSF